MVFSTAEVLDDDSRAIIGTAFGVAPFDVYAMTETGFMSWQCEKRASLHVNSDLVFVEILRGDVPALPGELGRVVVTTLRARTMPLLRYDTGDLATASAGPCPCGRTFPTMGPIEGRARHAIRAADGRTLTQRAVMNRLAGTLRMGDYRLRRKSERTFLLETTPSAFAAGVGATDAQRVLRELLGDVEIALEAIDALPGGLKTHAVVDDRVS
jgi:phenylacetate-coenzyme A ligase PaaK-like adenylate-forming protein